MKIGVFDSGFGGLTVLRELLRVVPAASYSYLGDTARLPYGSKSAATVARYAASSSKFLVDQGAELLVIACNTATALALDEIKHAISVPVIGVVEPGASAAAAITRTGNVDVIGTTATVASHAYAKSLKTKGVEATEKACPLLVPLVEEGWIDHPVTEQVARIYLEELQLFGPLEHVERERRADVLLLGCTHYPLLEPLLRRLLPQEISLVDSAASTAQVVAKQLRSLDEPTSKVGAPEIQFFATDSVEKFRALGERFLGRKINGVELISLPE
jgi:glutamate racemase